MPIVQCHLLRITFQVLLLYFFHFVLQLCILFYQLYVVGPFMPNIVNNSLILYIYLVWKNILDIETNNL